MAYIVILNTWDLSLCFLSFCSSLSFFLHVSFFCSYWFFLHFFSIQLLFSPFSSFQSLSFICSRNQKAFLNCVCWHSVLQPGSQNREIPALKQLNQPGEKELKAKTLLTSHRGLYELRKTGGVSGKLHRASDVWLNMTLSQSCQQAESE